METKSARCLILACGNTLRSDDGAGPKLAAWAEERFRQEPDVRVISRQQWTPDLAEDIAAADSVLFVDSSASSPPGRVRLIPVPSPVRQLSAVFASPQAVRTFRCDALTLWLNQIPCHAVNRRGGLYRTGRNIQRARRSRYPTRARHSGESRPALSWPLSELKLLTFRVIERSLESPTARNLVHCVHRGGRASPQSPSPTETHRRLPLR